MLSLTKKIMKSINMGNHIHKNIFCMLKDEKNNLNSFISKIEYTEILYLVCTCVFLCENK